MTNLQKYRNDFPLLSQANAPIYFDNACQSLRPNSVIEAMSDYYENYPACAGRSNHKLANKVAQKCDMARKKIASFINTGRSEEIIFTRNTTEGLNLVAHSLGLKSGDIVLTTDKEHNSNLVPWQMLAKTIGIKHEVVFSKSDNTFDIEAFKKLLNPQVKLVSMGFSSNLDGVSIPVSEIIKLAHQNGSLVLLDAAQAAAHQPIDVRRLDVDFLSFSGHKMLGPSGMGVLYGKYQLLEKLNAFMTGGDTVVSTTYDSFEFLKPPEKFEAGLQDYAGIIGLEAAVEYLGKIGLKTIHEHEKTLNQYASAALKEVPGLTIIGPEDASLRGGILSFYVKNMDSHQIALMLDQSAGIMVRSGQHCVHSWFNHHNLKGSVRASFYFYNTMDEVERFIRELKKIINVLN